MIQSWLSAWVVKILFHILCIAWFRDLQSETFDYLALRKKGVIIDLSDEYIFGHVQRVLTSAEVLFFPPEKLNPSGEVNTILFITVRAFQ